MANKLHAVILTLPFQGHINPSTNLAIKLASNGFTVTIVHTDYVHYRLTEVHRVNQLEESLDLLAEARKSGLDIRFRTFSDGFPMDFDRFLNLNEFGDAILRDFPARVEELVGEIIGTAQSDDQIPFLITDTFLPWSNVIAQKHNLVIVSFWAQPALVLSIGYHSDLLAENGHYPCKDDVEEEISYLPGIDSLNTRDLMPYFKESQISFSENRVTTLSFEAVKAVDFILCNTVDELETETISALNKRQPVYAIGPVHFIRNIPTYSSIPKSLLTESDCSEWLGSKKPGSVLYISFGSLVQPNKQDFEELTYGLLLSEVNFIWVDRASIIFPVGLQNEIKDKGLIVSWCDQMNVLSDPAVGGFLTHCGWNSICESMSAGVPMLCYPIFSDQLANRRLVVEHWKIGMDLVDGKLAQREKVAENIGKLMNGTSSKILRQEVENVKMVMQKGLEVDGCSEVKLNQFIKDLKTKICSTNKSASLAS